MSISFSHSRKTYISAKNGELDTETLHVTTQSDTDIVVVIGTGVNLLILRSKHSHPTTMLSCENLELVTLIVTYTIQCDDNYIKRQHVIAQQF